MVLACFHFCQVCIFKPSLAKPSWKHTQILICLNGREVTSLLVVWRVVSEPLSKLE